MIEIAKGNPTAEEIAALIAALAIVADPEDARPPQTVPGGWRRSSPSSDGSAGRWRTGAPQRARVVPSRTGATRYVS